MSENGWGVTGAAKLFSKLSMDMWSKGGGGLEVHLQSSPYLPRGGGQGALDNVQSFFYGFPYQSELSIINIIFWNEQGQLSVLTK